MKFSVMERLSLLNLLPAEGDLTTIRIVRKLREELSFSEEEHKQLNFRPVGENQVQWDDGVMDDKEFEFGAKAVGLIGEALEKLIKEKRVKEQHLTLFDKFQVGQDE